MCVAPKAQPSWQPGAAPQEQVRGKAPALKARFIPTFSIRAHFDDGYVFDVKANRCLESRFTLPLVIQ